MDPVRLVAVWILVCTVTAFYPNEITHRNQVLSLQEDLRKDELQTNLGLITSFHTRYYTSQSGLESSLWLARTVQTLARDVAQVEIVHHGWLQKSVIASIRGTETPENVIVIGSHLDSSNLVFPAFMSAPGADDNASGVVTALEVLRVLCEHGFRPRNSVEFHWYSAEEAGLLGSRDIFERYKHNNRKVVAMVQHDMAGFTQGSLDHGRPAVFGLVTDNADAALTTYLKLLISEYCDVSFVETTCGYACSDHVSAARSGFRSALVTESDLRDCNGFVHTTSDTMDKLSLDHIVQHCKLSVAYAYELGFWTVPSSVD